MLIRRLEPADIPAVARLLRALALEFIVNQATPEEASTFLRENDEDGVRGFVARGHVCHVALIDGELAGFVGVRDRSHLFHLFVDRRWHRQGVGRRLWEVARDAAITAGNPGSFTVNASAFALPVYEAFGFIRTAPMQCLRGVRFYPMRLTVSPQR